MGCQANEQNERNELDQRCLMEVTVDAIRTTNEVLVTPTPREQIVVYAVMPRCG